MEVAHERSFKMEPLNGNNYYNWKDTRSKWTIGCGLD